MVADAWDNLDQFLLFHPEVVRYIEAHDTGVQKLLECCRAYQDALVQSPALRNLYERMARECPETLGGQIPDYFGAYSEKEDFLAVLAENIVNNFEKLPSYYRDDLMAI